MNSPKLKGSLLKQLDKDEINRIERLHIQSNYAWLNSFVRNNQESAMDENYFEIPIAPTPYILLGH